MSDEINFKNWDAPLLSEDVYEKVKLRAGQKVVSRRKRRRVYKATVVVICLCAISAVLYLKTTSIDRQFAEAKDLIEKEIRTNRDYLASSKYDDRRYDSKEEGYENMARD